MLKIVQENLESGNWILVNDKSVNPNPVQSMFPQFFAGALNVHFVSVVDYGGALLHLPQGLPMMNGQFVTPWVGYDLEFMLTDEAAALCRCVEIDFKASMIDAKGQTIANIVDGSSQICLYDGSGRIQIDNQAMTWTDTGFATGPLPANTWIPWSGRYHIDVPSKKFSVLSISVNGSTYAIPAAMQNLTWGNSNWGMAVEPALQLDGTHPSAFQVRYRNIGLTWSDQQF